MAEKIPAIIRHAAIARFLEIIRKSGTPGKVDGNYLKSVGFKDTNDTALIGVFKKLGFLDNEGKPTQVYKDYKGVPEQRAKEVLGSAIKQAYAGLFRTYPDADRRDDEAITNWIRANTDAGEVTHVRALNTFKALRSEATFTDAAPVALPADTAAVDEDPRSSEANAPAGKGQQIYARSGPDVTINVNLEIAATSDPAIYDSFFAAMKKHLFPDAT
jgi:hypothetical protein